MFHSIATSPASSEAPLVSFHWSWNAESWFVDGRFSRLALAFGREVWALFRIALAMAVAVSLERHLPSLRAAGNGPLPVVVAVLGCYVVSSSYGRMLSACVVAGLFRDAFSTTVPLGTTSLLFVLVAVVVRELVKGRVRLSDEMLAGVLLVGVTGLLGHVAMVATGVGGQTQVSVLATRILGSAFVGGVVLVPMLLPVKTLAGRGLDLGVRLAGAGTAALLAWMLSHLNFGTHNASLRPHRPLLAGS
jgi:hypothetical protein